MFTSEYAIFIMVSYCSFLLAFFALTFLIYHKRKKLVSKFRQQMVDTQKLLSKKTKITSEKIVSKSGRTLFSFEK